MSSVRTGTTFEELEENGFLYKTDDPYETGDIMIIDGTRPRDLNTLLKLDSYQTMTDTEIKLVVAWKEMMAAREAKNAAMEEAYQTAFDAFREQISEALASADANFKTACSIVPGFKTVEDGDA